MDEFHTLLLAIAAAVGSLIPILAKWVKAKLTTNTCEEELKQAQLHDLLSQLQKDRDEDSKVLNTISDAIQKQHGVHGLNPDDITCKQDINDELEALRSKVGATRITVWSFHNGNYFTTGNPQRKLTTVFEATPPDKDVGSEYDLLRGELLNGFAVVLKRLSLGAVLNKGGTIVEPGMTVYSACEQCPLFKQCDALPSLRPHNCVLRCDINDMPMCSKFYRLMRQLCTKVWYGRTICDEYGKPSGVVTVQFEDTTQEAEDFLKNYSQDWCDLCTRVVSSIAYLKDLS